MQEFHPEAEAKCIKEKWNMFKEWRQGFDSDCFAHCSNYDHCIPVFDDKRVHGENHLKMIIVPCNEKLYWGDEEVVILDLD